MNIDKELNFISNNGLELANTYSLMLHTPNDTVRLDAVEYTLTRDADYVNDNYETYHLNITLPAPVVKLLGNYRDLCEIHFTLENNKGNSVFRRYRALLHQNNELGDLLNTNIQPINLEHILVNVDIQLVLLAYEQLDNAIVQGVIIEDTKPSEIIKTLYLNALSAIGLKKVIITPLDNKDPVGRFIIPSRTYLLDIISMLSKKYGLYHQGANVFISMFGEEPVVYVYPTHRTNFDTQLPVEYRRNLIAVVGNVDIISKYSPTYYVNPNNVRIICSDSKVDKTQVTQNPITGISEINALGIVQQPTEPSATSPFINKPSKIMNHYNTGKRVDGVNPTLPPSTPRNVFDGNSEIVKGNRETRVLVWQNGNGEVLVPGMAVEIIDEVEDKLIRTTGTLIGFTSSNYVKRVGSKKQMISSEVVILKVVVAPRVVHLNLDK